VRPVHPAADVHEHSRGGGWGERLGAVAAPAADLGCDLLDEGNERGVVQGFGGQAAGVRLAVEGEVRRHPALGTALPCVQPEVSVVVDDADHATTPDW